tara:strand:- start:832 stop:2283 length:1452 start_codon:yes stop_codon:yes gene_type:complete
MITLKKTAGLLGGLCLALTTYTSSAQTLYQNDTGTHDGYYYSFWKDSGDASFTLMPGGRYQSQWNSSTNNWVGGKGWNPGGRKVVNYEGYYGVNSSQNSYLALYGWTRNPLIEFYIIESYGSYDPSSCSGGTNYGTFQSDGATYRMRRCQRVQQPSIEGTQTFYQYFSVREPIKGYGNVSGTITTGNHFDAWASVGLNLGSFDYMVMASEGYQSSGSSDITVSEDTSGGGSSNGGSGGPSSTDIVVNARGAAGGEHINLLIDGIIVADWTLSTSMSAYIYSGSAAGDIQVEYDNDFSGADVILDNVYVNGETREAESMEYNTATYGNGECGGGSYSETMHCNGVIGFGDTGACFSGNCAAPPPANDPITVRAEGVSGSEHINLLVGGNVVADWTLAPGMNDYTYSGGASGDVQVEYDNDASGRDVILDYVLVNGEIREAENMEYNTATYGNGSCGGGSYSETMHCSGVIGFGDTDACFSNNCN